MIDALAAEWMKLRRLRATWLLVWIYPLILLLVGAASILYGMTSSGTASQAPAPDSLWAAQSAAFWTFPVSTFGRYFIASFTVFCFASEYGWNTWKLIVPTRPRWQLVAAKWGACLGLLFAAYIAADTVTMVTSLLHAALVGPPLPGGVTLASVLMAHANAMGASIAPTLYTVSAAALLSVVTRSTLGALLSSIALISAEAMLPLAAAFLQAYVPGLAEPLLQALPMFHVGNLVQWAREGSAWAIILEPERQIGASWTTSFLMTLGWSSGFALLTQWAFARQDIH